MTDAVQAPLQLHLQSPSFLYDLAYFTAALLFVFGLRGMGQPARARRGIRWAGAGMLLALIATLFHPALQSHHVLILVAILVGGGLAFFQARRVSMNEMPSMVALYNSLGGGAAAGIAAIELLRAAEHGGLERAVAVGGGLIGCVALAGSGLAWLRLSGKLGRRHRVANRQVLYLASISLALLLGLLLAASQTPHPVLLVVFFVLSLSFGLMMTMPISDGDLPVLISLYNAMTGLAVALDGLVLGSPAMVVAGSLVFAAGLLLTRLMAHAVNRRLSEMMYSGFGLSFDDRIEPGEAGRVHEIDAYDAANALAWAEQVVIVPGYGMAVAQAQHKLRELTQLLEERGVVTRFAIHPVAGRMPGHMNVLLAEAGVPYEKIVDIAEINPEFETVDVVLVVGANDIVNTGARDDDSSPLFGMRILDVDRAGHVIVLKRGTGTGYAGIENPLLQLPNTRVHFGDGRQSVQDLITAIKSFD